MEAADCSGHRTAYGGRQCRSPAANVPRPRLLVASGCRRSWPPLSVLLAPVVHHVPVEQPGPVLPTGSRCPLSTETFPLQTVAPKQQRYALINGGGNTNPALATSSGQSYVSPSSSRPAADRPTRSPVWPAGSTVCRCAAPLLAGGISRLARDDLGPIPVTT